MMLASHVPRRNHDISHGNLNMGGLDKVSTYLRSNEINIEENKGMLRKGT